MDLKTKAKKTMLEQLKKMMSDEMHSPISESIKNKDMKKVTVMSDSEDGLEEGLEKAKEIMEKKDMMEDKGMEEDEGVTEDEISEDLEKNSEYEEESMDSEEDDEEAILAKMESLKRKLNSLK